MKIQPELLALRTIENDLESLSKEIKFIKEKKLQAQLNFVKTDFFKNDVIKWVENNPEEMLLYYIGVKENSHSLAYLNSNKHCYYFDSTLDNIEFNTKIINKKSNKEIQVTQELFEEKIDKILLEGKELEISSQGINIPITSNSESYYEHENNWAQDITIYNEEIANIIKEIIDEIYIIS